MKLDILEDDELFRLAAHQGGYNEYIDKEWKSRYRLSFPYQLVADEQKVYNALLDQKIDYVDCDIKIVEQSKIIKGVC
ncbi:hypothetical protein [Virgibacillus profundi]|nr:hypothetical protein [Virgibacillus profundi]